MALRNKELCICCGVLHDPRYCSQCIAAGCNHKGPRERCRLSDGARAIAKIPEVELRNRYEQLSQEFTELIIQARQMVDIIHSIDPKLLNTLPRKGFPNITVMGANPAAAQGAVSNG